MFQIIHPDQVWNSFCWTDPIVKQKVVGWIHNYCATVEPMGKSCQEGQFCTGLQHWGRSLASFLSQHFLLLRKLAGREIDSWSVQDWLFFPSPVSKVGVAFSSGVSPRPSCLTMLFSSHVPDDALSPAPMCASAALLSIRPHPLPLQPVFLISCYNVWIQSWCYELRANNILRVYVFLWVSI